MTETCTVLERFSPYSCRKIGFEYISTFGLNLDAVSEGRKASPWLGWQLALHDEASSSSTVTSCVSFVGVTHNDSIRADFDTRTDPLGVCMAEIVTDGA